MPLAFTEHASLHFNVLFKNIIIINFEEFQKKLQFLQNDRIFKAIVSVNRDYCQKKSLKN